MSVIVKGIKKPNRCDNGQYRCLFLDDYDDCKLQDTDEFWDFEEMYKHCPLVEIPEGARLIDGNKISSDMDDMKVEGETFVTAVNFVKLIVNDAPVIFEEE